MNEDEKIIDFMNEVIYQISNRNCKTYTTEEMILICAKFELFFSATSGYLLFYPIFNKPDWKLIKLEPKNVFHYMSNKVYDECAKFNPNTFVIEKILLDKHGALDYIGNMKRIGMSTKMIEHIMQEAEILEFEHKILSSL